nr:VOC family protein [uncultured Flavobacterium sp.]
MWQKIIRKKMNLNQIIVSVKDIEKSIAYYEKLGLKLILRSINYARFECPEGDATFSICLAENELTDFGTTLYFESNNLNQKVNELIEKGIHFEQIPINQKSLWKEAILRDPDNNRIKLFYAGDNKKNNIIEQSQ